jgi:hypothetical protein
MLKTTAGGETALTAPLEIYTLRPSASAQG